MTSTVTHPDLAATLYGMLSGRTCIVGIGNRLRGDDGAGPAVIDARPPGAAGTWLDAGTAPENLLEPIVRLDPEVILVVDAVDFGGDPGTCRLLDPAGLDTVAWSTHHGSLDLLSRYLCARTHARLHVLAIQPQSIDPGEGLSDPVRQAVDALSRILAAHPACASPVSPGNE